MKFLEKIKETITGLEGSRSPLIYFILTFIAATTLRILLEFFSDRTPISGSIIYHYYLFYVNMILAMILLFYVATKESIGKIARIILPFYFIIISAPILDLIISGGKGFNMAFLYPGQHGDLMLRFFTFWGDFSTRPFRGVGVTPGMRIEIVIFLAASFVYFYIKRGSVIRSIFFTFLMYAIIYIYSITPFIVKYMDGLFSVRQYQGSMKLKNIENLYLLLIFIYSGLLFFLHNKRFFVEIIKDIRFSRLVHYELMFVLGFALTKIFTPEVYHLSQNGLYQWIFIMISIVIASLVSIITNNMSDYDIDKISNTERPLVSGSVSKEQYRNILPVLLFLAAVYSAQVNFIAFFITFVFMSGYFLYSMPPLRLKRVPFFSKLIISGNSLLLLVLGSLCRAGSPLVVPRGIFVFFLICVTASANFIDIKDYEGDKSEGIRTLPVILGLKKGKRLIGCFFLISYIVAAIMLKNIYLYIPVVAAGILQFWLISRQRYNEKPVFIVYLASIAMLIIYLLLAGIPGKEARKSARQLPPLEELKTRSPFPDDFVGRMRPLR